MSLNHWHDLHQAALEAQSRAYVAYRMMRDPALCQRLSRAEVESARVYLEGEARRALIDFACWLGHAANDGSKGAA